MILRNHLNMLICSSRKKSHYYQCWKQLCCLVLWKPWIFRFSESSDFWKVPKWIVVVCKILHLAFSVSRRKCWFKKCFFFFVCVDWSKHCPPHYTEEGIWGVVTALTGCSPWVLYIFCFAFLNASWASILLLVQLYQVNDMMMCYKLWRIPARYQHFWTNTVY